MSDEKSGGTVRGATLPICPECLTLAADDHCPRCGVALDLTDALLTVTLDRATVKDQQVFLDIEFTEGSWDPKKRVAKIRTPEEWGALYKTGARILRRKGTGIIGPTGVSFEYGDPVLECMSTRKTSTLRACMSQGLGESYCNELPGLLPLSDAPNHLSLGDGLRELGMDAGGLTASVIQRLSGLESSPVRCPLFGPALDAVPLGDELLAALEGLDAGDGDAIPVLRDDQEGVAVPPWEVVPMPEPALDEAMTPIGEPPAEPLTWGVAQDGIVIGERGGVPVILSTEADGGGWALPPMRHPGDLCIVVPSRWSLFWRRFSRARRSETQASWYLPGPGTVILRTMPASIQSMASFGSVPTGPRAMLVASSQRLVVQWADEDEAPAVIAGSEITGDVWRMAPLNDSFLLLWSDGGDLFLYGNQVIWRLSPSRPGERWPLNPWYSELFDSPRSILPIPQVGLAILSSDGHRLSVLTLDEAAAADTASTMELTPPVEIREELVLPRQVTSMGVDREGRIHLASKDAMILLDPKARTRAATRVAAGTSVTALETGGWILEDDQGIRRVILDAPPPREDFGEDLLPFLKDLEVMALNAENLKPRRTSLVENLYSLMRRRARRARRLGE